MAIDSASKRQSALTFGLPFMRGLIPDGVIDQGDRQNIVFSYSGILAAVAVVTDAIDTILFTLHINQNRAIAGYINQNRSITGYINQQKDFDLEG